MNARRLKALLPLSAIVFLVACGGAADVPHFQLSDQLASGQTLGIRNVTGSVTVRPSTDGQLHVVAEGLSHGSRPERVRMETARGANGITVCAMWGRGGSCVDGDYSPSTGSFWSTFAFRSRVEVNFTVQLPAGVRLDIRDVNGEVTVAGATSDVLVHSINGGIRAATDGGTLELKSVNGNVTADVRNAPRRVSAKTINGSVEVIGPAELAGDVDMSVVNGSIESDFAVTTTGKLSKRKLVGRIGAGGVPLEIKSVNGSVSLHRRA